jgi:tripartite-type tricarboxylate transporter receptor subunit TctC
MKYTIPTDGWGEGTLHFRGQNMKLLRRQFLQLLGASAALQMTSRFAQAQAYPARPARIIVGFAAGGTNDIFARLIGQWLSDKLGQPYIVEDRPGAGGNIAADAVVRSQSDGYTLHLASTPDTVNSTLYDKISFNYVRDTVPVASIMRTPLVVVANPSVPVRTISEFITYTKANSRTLNMASAGIGTPPHIAGELFKTMTGVNMQHVPYRGGAPAVADMVGGQMQIMFAVMPDCIEQVRAGKLRALAVTTSTPSDALPGIPTVADILPGYESSFWIGITAPKNTPADIIEKLNREINRALVDPTIKARITELGGSVLSGSPADFGKLIADETEKWGKVIRAANIKIE